MQYSKIVTCLVIVTLTMLFGSCSNTRFLTGDQILYTGLGKVSLVSKEKIENRKTALEVINSATSAKINNSLFGKNRMLPPFGLWVRNYLKPKEGKKPGWFYKSFQSEPILISNVNPQHRCEEIESALFGIGFFNSNASYVIDTNKRNSRKAKISYIIKVDEPYRINKIVNPPVVDAVDSMIKSNTKKMDIKPGDFFSLDAIKAEKQKISSVIVEQGYYFFGPDNIKFIADTTEVPFQINLMTGKSPETQEFVCLKYSIDQVKVKLTGVLFDSSSQNALPDTIMYDGVFITGLKNYLEPEVLTRCIQFRKGDLYATSKHQATIRQLNNYGVFKYVKMQFIVKDSVHQKMDILIELSPKNDVSLNLEGYAQAKSTGFAGPGIETTLAHSNIGKQANKLQLKLSGGFEWQLGTNDGESLGSNSYNAGINSSFVFPRLVLPFRLPGESKLISSKTVCSLGFDFTNNNQFYRLNGINLGFSYQWKKRQKITNVFFPLKINVVNLIQTTPEFDSIINSNPYVKKSFEEQSIYGLEYDFIYDNTFRKKNSFYLQAIIGTSGNLIDRVRSIQGGERPYSILGNVYSQFIKPSLDIRFYTKTVKEGFVFRIYAGAGFSYKNSSVMPYVEQFYSGGSNSLRGFAARSIGPGSYQPVEFNGIVDQTGDIKLEFNVEYRFRFSKLVLGALFAETGNVWLLNEDIGRPGAEFGFNSFADQLAVGTGIGLRFDFGFFVLRTDFGFPLRNPYDSGNGHWRSKADDILSDFKLNIAIGFPF